jgi:hypothetical protein
MSTIRISEKTRDTLRALARTDATPMSDVLDRAVELYRRRRLLDAHNAAYAELRGDPAASATFEAEQADWDATLMDGLADEAWDETPTSVATEDHK